MSIKLPINFSLNLCKFPHSNKQKLIFYSRSTEATSCAFPPPAGAKSSGKPVATTIKKRLLFAIVAITDRTGWHPTRRQDRVSGQIVFHYSEHHASLFSAHQRNEAVTHTHTRPTATELLQKLLEGHVRPIQTNDTWHTKKFKLIHNDIQYKLINFIIKLDRFCAKEATSNQLSEVLLVTLTFRDKGGIKDP